MARPGQRGGAQGGAEDGVEPEEQGEEEAERVLLARLLFSPPPRQLISGERNGLRLDTVVKQLQAWFTMISGRRLKLAYSDPPSTDSHNLYLPRALPAPERAEDLAVYRMMGLVQVGFIRYGLLEDRALLTAIYQDWLLRSAWHLLAARYVLRCWGEEFPGIRADLGPIARHAGAGVMRVNVTPVPREGMPGAFLPLYEGLAEGLGGRAPGSEGDPARAAIRAVDRHRGPGARALLSGQAQSLRDHFRRLRLGPPPLPFWLGILRPEWILADLSRDIAYEQEWKKGNKPLRQLMEAIAKKGGAFGAGAFGLPPAAAPEPPRLSLRERLLQKLSGPDMSKAPAYGALRDEFVAKQRTGGGEGELLPSGPAARPEEEGFAYEEWDDAAGVYRVEAARVFEVDAPTGGLENYQRIREANRRAINETRRRFEQLRVEERWLHGQRDGAELDIGRLITAMTDLRAGQQPDDRIYKRFVRQRQPVAILTLVDVSGSTQGRVLPVEQEAVVLFSEGLRTLDMPHAFYGFSNTHALSCELQRIKRFDEPGSDAAYKRLGNLRAGGATRMGAFVRHAAKLLGERPQPRRILLMLSDGRPEDRGEYRGSYGVRDTMMAVQEARRQNVHTFCISVDSADDAGQYLEQIFGKAGFLSLPSVELLPKRLPEVFRRMIR